MRSLLSELFRPRRPSAKGPRTFRPSCEALEDRLAPSSAVALPSITGEPLVGVVASHAIAISPVNGLGTGYASVSAGSLAPRTYQAGPDSLTLTALDNHASGYSFAPFPGSPPPSGAPVTSAPASGANGIMSPALTQSSEPQAAGQASTADAYWLALAQDPLARPGLV